MFDQISCLVWKDERLLGCQLRLLIENLDLVPRNSISYELYWPSLGSRYYRLKRQEPGESLVW